MKLSAASVEAARGAVVPPPSRKSKAMKFSDLASEDLIEELSRRYKEGEIDEADFEGTALAGMGDEVIESLHDFEEALAWWRRGDKKEALHYLENALGSDFRGLGEMKPEDLR